MEREKKPGARMGREARKEPAAVVQYEDDYSRGQRADMF